jgi:hypothetical protein
MPVLKIRKILSNVNKFKNAALAAMLKKKLQTSWSLVKFQIVVVIDPRRNQIYILIKDVRISIK